MRIYANQVNKTISRPAGKIDRAVFFAGRFLLLSELPHVCHLQDPVVLQAAEIFFYKKLDLSRIML